MSGGRWRSWGNLSLTRNSLRRRVRRRVLTGSPRWTGSTSLDAHPLAKKHFIQHIRAEYTTEPERFSLLDLARNASMYYLTEFRGENYRVIGGNDRIPCALADRLPDVRLNAEVTSIQLLPDGVAVTYQQNDTYQTIHSAFAILAIPLTTARRIDFHGSLPFAHQRMVDEVSYGAVTKVLIQYRKRFWEEKGWNGRLATDATHRLHLACHQPRRE